MSCSKYLYSIYSGYPSMSFQKYNFTTSNSAFAKLRPPRLQSLAQTSFTEHPIGMNRRFLWTAWYAVKWAHKVIKIEQIILMIGKHAVILLNCTVTWLKWDKFDSEWMQMPLTANWKEKNLIWYPLTKTFVHEWSKYRYLVSL